MTIYGSMPNNNGRDLPEFRLHLIEGLVDKHNSAVPQPVHGSPSTEPPPKRLNVISYSKFSTSRRRLSQREVACTQNKENDKKQHISPVAVK
jgi:hypothetical protein